MRELFVYYRVASAEAAGCEAAVRDLQARLAHDVPGLVARLLARPETTNGEETWMETYALAGTGVDPVLQQRIASEAVALAPFLRGERHVEVFIARR